MNEDDDCWGQKINLWNIEYIDYHATFQSVQKETFFSPSTSRSSRGNPTFSQIAEPATA